MEKNSFPGGLAVMLFQLFLISCNNIDFIFWMPLRLKEFLYTIGTVS